VQSLIAQQDHMANITIRNLDEHMMARLRWRAARHKRSMEDEARNILRTALFRLGGHSGQSS
jgi:plasmid stability protein